MPKYILKDRDTDINNNDSYFNNDMDIDDISNSDKLDDKLDDKSDDKSESRSNSADSRSSSADSKTTDTFRDKFQERFIDNIKIKFATVINLCDTFTKNPDCVFKLCGDRWLIVLEMCPDTITNENREDIYDTNYAKFRANRLVVRFIVNIHSTVQLDKLVHRFISIDGTVNSVINYVLDEAVVPEHPFDSNLDIVCSSGIHYFKNILSTIGYRKLPSLYNGRCIQWYPNGRKRLQGVYKNGRKMGKWKYYYSNGHKDEVVFYVDGIMRGDIMRWNYDGTSVDFNLFQFDDTDDTYDTYDTDAPIVAVA